MASTASASKVCVAQRAAGLSSRRTAGVAPTAAPVRARRVRLATVEGAYFTPQRTTAHTFSTLFLFFVLAFSKRPFPFKKNISEYLAATPFGRRFFVVDFFSFLVNFYPRGGYGAFHTLERTPSWEMRKDRTNTSQKHLAVVVFLLTENTTARGAHCRIRLSY